MGVGATVPVSCLLLIISCMTGNTYKLDWCREIIAGNPLFIYFVFFSFLLQKNLIDNVYKHENRRQGKKFIVVYSVELL